MKELKFKVTLITDIVLNKKAATEGNQQTLDFIPGNSFLGIVARELYSKLSPQESLLLFHTGKVKFGDAHPMRENERALHIPASFYHAKLEGDKRILVHHGMPTEDNDEIRNFEPKQYRSGFFYISNINEQTALKDIECGIDKSFSIKSAYDKEFRRSKEGQMYGYESLDKGSEWMFSVFVEEEATNFAERIINALTGKQRIGRSRTAQYGLIEINKITSSDYNPETKFDNQNYALVYADARLIFLDDYGFPTFQPNAEALGFYNGKIIWENSQVRTFQYAPWNSTRQTRDADRCGIEKGSVFYIIQSGDMPLEYTGNHFVGDYQNEGFGKIMINPPFLKIKEGNFLGESQFFINEKKRDENVVTYKESNKGYDGLSDKLQNETPDFNSPILSYLKQQKQKEEKKHIIYMLINQFIKDNEDAFISDKFSSQWGTIRSLAIQYEKRYEREKKIEDYISRGVASNKWSNNGRGNLLKNFMKHPELKDEYMAQLAIINLASEMAKL